MTGGTGNNADYKIALCKIDGIGTAQGDKIITMPAALTSNTISKQFFLSALSKIPTANRLAITGLAADANFTTPFGPAPNYQPFLFLINIDLTNLSKVATYNTNQYGVEEDVTNVIAGAPGNSDLVFAYAGPYGNSIATSCGTAVSAVVLMNVRLSNLAVNFSVANQSACQYESTLKNNVIKGGFDASGNPRVVIGYTDQVKVPYTSYNSTFLVTDYSGTPMSMYKRTTNKDNNHFACFDTYDNKYFIEQSFDWTSPMNMRLAMTDMKGYVNNNCSFSEHFVSEATTVTRTLHDLFQEDKTAVTELPTIEYESPAIEMTPCN